MNPCIIGMYETDLKWMYPYLDYDLKNDYNFSQLCNEERRKQLPLVLNHKNHISKQRDDLLQGYYNRHLSLKWLACVSDISMPSHLNHYTGSILLNHLVQHKGNLFQTLFLEPKQIDYHAWLQTSRIKYFGKRQQAKISVGDVILGESWIKKYYKESDKRSHYGLGKTIITDCGMPFVKYPPANSVAIDLPEVEIVSNYDRGNDYIVELTYPDYYSSILNRYKTININTLQFIKGYVHTNFEKSNYINYHDRVNQNNHFKIIQAFGA